jgi:hypothetical protein
MRQAAADKNLDKFHKHLGNSFSKQEAKGHMERIHSAITSGSLKLKR